MKEVIIDPKSRKLRNEAKLLGLGILDEREIPVFVINEKKDEKSVIRDAEGKEEILLEFSGQKIIPLENLIAALRGKTRVLVKVGNSKEARTAMETLELGADGVVLETADEKELKKTMEAVLPGKEIELEEAKVTAVRELGMGARACIDTCDLMTKGEGMLVGSSSQAMMLVQAEVEENPFVSKRPFRVNAGAVSLYTLSPGEKTVYLEEIEAGCEVMIVDRKGKTRAANVARSKIELRPLVLVEAESKKRAAKAVLQNAETIRVVTPEGSIPVTEIKPGDKVICRFESGGRHFGTLVKEEQVIEK